MLLDVTRVVTEHVTRVVTSPTLMNCAQWRLTERVDINSLLVALEDTNNKTMSIRDEVQNLLVT